MTSLPAPLPPGLPDVPPGQDDLPYDDGRPLESDKHRQQMTLLIQPLARHLRDRTDVFVGGNLGVYYSMLQVARREFLVPDVFVALGVELVRERKSWVIWEEGVGPAVVIELLSDSTQDEDRGRKMRLYSKSLHVPEYILYDPRNGDLEGHTLNGAGGYGAMPSESVGSAQLGLRLVVWDGEYEGRTSFWLRWATPEGVLLPTAEEAAETEKARADALRAQLRALGVEPAT